MLRIYLFGYLRINYQDAPLSFNVRPQTPLLLAYLLLHCREPVPRLAISTALWLDKTETKGLASLRRHLHELTTVLPPDTEWILREGSTLQWNPEADYWCDAVEFIEKSQNPAQLAESISLYRDDLLVNEYAEWLDDDRTDLKNQLMSNLLHLLEQNRQHQDLQRAIDYAQHALQVDPFREETVQLLMQMQYQVGSRAAALNTYENFVENLRTELDVEPMQETIDLYQAILDETLVIEAIQVPILIPAPSTSFIGRETEVQTLVAQLTQPDSRLISILGPAGIGKTRLAIEVAHQLIDYFRDGIFFVDLTELSQAVHLESLIAQTIQTKIEGQSPTADWLHDYVTERHLLLVLDNFEHVVEASPKIAELLNLAVDLRILVTSRIPLRLSMEHEFSLEPLAYPQNEISMAEIDQFSALTLFINRAKQRQSKLKITDANAVSLLCQQLDGLPLAIELAAARTKTHTIKELTAQLRDRFALLKSEFHDSPPRHLSLRTAIEWSYQLLDDTQQCIFNRLGIFVAGWNLEMASVIIPEMPSVQLQDILYELVDQHLILMHKSDEQGTRYSMLVSMREFAREQLPTTDGYAAIYCPLAEYFANLVEEARENWDSDAVFHWLPRLRQEEENIRDVLQWTLPDDASPDEFENRQIYGVRIISALGNFWKAQGNIGEGLCWFEKALPFAHKLDEKAYLMFLIRISITHQVKQSYERSKELLDEALELAYRLEENQFVGMVNGQLGILYGRQGQFAEAENYLSEAIKYHRESSIDPGRELAAALCNLAIVKRHLKEYEEAQALYEASIAIDEQNNDFVNVAVALTNLGNLMGLQDDFAQAMIYYLRAFEIDAKIGNRQSLMILLINFPSVYIKFDKYEQATLLYGFLEKFAQQLNYPKLQPHAEKQREKNIELLLSELGQARFDELKAEGYALSYEQAIEFVRLHSVV